MDFEQKHKEDLQRLREFRLLDDDFMSKVFEDKKCAELLLQIILDYVNSQIRDETKLGRLMHDFSCTDAKDMYYEILADRVHYFKEDEKGVTTMCKAMEEMRNEAAIKAAHERSVENAKKMLQDEMEYEKVARYSGLTIEEVKALDGQKSA